MKKIFATYDPSKTGFVDTEQFGPILTQLGSNFDDEELQIKIDEVDDEGEGKVNFEMFLKIVMPFLEDEDDEAMNEELKEAFRLYDKEGQGYITTQVLKEIMKEPDSRLSEEDIIGIVDEVDEDGSGTLDFDEFMDIIGIVDEVDEDGSGTLDFD